MMIRMRRVAVGVGQLSRNQARPTGASSGNWTTTASKGSREMTWVSWPLPVVSSMSQASPALIVTASPTPGVTRTLPAQTEEDLTGWRPVTLADPTGWQLEQNETRRWCRSCYGKWVRGWGEQGHLAFDLERVETAQPGVLRAKPLYLDRSDHDLVPPFIPLPRNENP
jgi:hypothetical protein